MNTILKMTTGGIDCLHMSDHPLWWIYVVHFTNAYSHVTNYSYIDTFGYYNKKQMGQ